MFISTKIIAEKNIPNKILGFLGKLTDVIFKQDDITTKISLMNDKLNSEITINSGKTILLEARGRKYTEQERQIVTQTLKYFASLNLLEGVDKIVFDEMPTENREHSPTTCAIAGSYDKETKTIIIKGSNTLKIITHEVGHAVFEYCLNDFQKQEYLKHYDDFYDFDAYRSKYISASEDFAQKFELYFNFSELFSAENPLAKTFVQILKIGEENKNIIHLNKTVLESPLYQITGSDLSRLKGIIRSFSIVDRDFDYFHFHYDGKTNHLIFLDAIDYLNLYMKYNLSEEQEQNVKQNIENIKINNARELSVYVRIGFSRGELMITGYSEFIDVYPNKRNLLVNKYSKEFIDMLDKAYNLAKELNIAETSSYRILADKEIILSRFSNWESFDQYNLYSAITDIYEPIYKRNLLPEKTTNILKELGNTICHILQEDKYKNTNLNIKEIFAPKNIHYFNLPQNTYFTDIIPELLGNK